MLKILVTGANGFIGSHIVESLLKAKYHVICAVRVTSSLEWIKNLMLEYRYGNLSDKSFLKTVVKDVDFIVHCAGIVRAITRDEYFKVNLGNTKNLCEVILKHNRNLKKFIFVSSQAVMGPAKPGVVKVIGERETPISSYGVSKLAAEMEIKKIFFGKIAYTILRPAAVYGPRDKDIFMLFNLIHSHLRPVTIKKRLVQLVYVKDVAESVVACLKNVKTNNNIYYLADPCLYTWSSVGRIISSSINIWTVPLPIPDFVFKFTGLISEIYSFITKKTAVLNMQKVIEMLQESWIADTKPAESDLNIVFTRLDVASKITYNWYLVNNFFWGN